MGVRGRTHIVYVLVAITYCLRYGQCLWRLRPLVNLRPWMLASDERYVITNSCLRLQSSWLESRTVTELRVMASSLVFMVQSLYIWPMMRAIVRARSEFEPLHVSIAEHVAGRSTKLADFVRLALRNTQNMRMAFECLDLMLMRIHLTRVTWSLLQLKKKLPAVTLDIIAEFLVEGDLSLLDHEDPNLNMEVVNDFVRDDDWLSDPISTSAMTAVKALAQASL